MKAEVGDLILVVDQRTSRLDEFATSRRNVDSAYPKPGWVEQDSDSLLASVLGSARNLLSNSGVKLS